MAVYKVPQDVEAEDKLLGPFSFKQFIFLIITAMALGIAYGLSRVLVPLAIIPIPIAIFFGVLAMPLRKDQPMEVYLAAIISFLMKPKVRLWQPDGRESVIEITAPKVDESILDKQFTQDEVNQRLSYLANLVDSHGWSIRGVSNPNTSMREDLYHEAQSISDPLDEGSNRALSVEGLMEKSNQQYKQNIINQMRHASGSQTASAQPPAQHPPATPIYTPVSTTPSPESPDVENLVINPYPTMRQSVVQPVSSTPSAPSTSSQTTVSPAIVDLANNHNDLTIETLQREAKRLVQKEKDLTSEEVVISLR